MNATFPLPLGLPPLPAGAGGAGAPAGRGEPERHRSPGVPHRPHAPARAVRRPRASWSRCPTSIHCRACPRNLLGLVNLHGRIVPLFDLAALFETTAPAAREAHVARDRPRQRRRRHRHRRAAAPHGVPARRRRSSRRRCRGGRGCRRSRPTLQATDAWFEFNYAQLLDQLVS